MPGEVSETAVVSVMNKLAQCYDQLPADSFTPQLLYDDCLFARSLGTGSGDLMVLFS